MRNPILSHSDFILIEKPGKTLALLKERSKPVQCGRKRKKVETLGTYAQYKESKQKPQASDSAPELSQSQPILNVEPPTDTTNDIPSLFAAAKGKGNKAAKMSDE